ncbi:PEP-utilizing enzyme [Actinokineospora auranticolor]|uniref:PEP-utilizing family enzyme n=1 Tax=Actinokineospora auranticolor TaxID=155976 RepID=A0A2S6GNX3_9PSEU|nr:PEP-utilizing enzyme [Actinokineospora auranticolor]PPK66880.1 PEP-utilizing family enzyme [Actinokineospora auranticolor]
MVRTFTVFRAFYLRAATLTTLGEDIFLLTFPETLLLLAGDETPLAALPPRRQALRTYRALPPYPPMIRGEFDPVTWASTPDRRTDIHTKNPPPHRSATEITGLPGLPGIITGTARVATTVEEAQSLRPGEILVAPATNIGWTPIFPRAAAVVTDIGAPLSHAAIVARELGIPAIVGCGDATTRLSTGDTVRVDGAKGTVTLNPPD